MSNWQTTESTFFVLVITPIVIYTYIRVTQLLEDLRLEGDDELMIS